MNRKLTAALAASLAGCATTQATTTGTKAEPVMEKMAIINVLPFDIAACGPRALELSPLTQELAMGALLSMGPAFQECLIDPKATDGAVAAKLKVTVAAEVSVEVSGTGVAQPGKDCLTAAVKKLGFKVEAAATPIVAEVPLQAAMKPVVFNTNAASDLVGTIRLAQPSMCECYAQVGTKAPPALVAKVSIAKDKPVDVTMEPTEAQAVAECVQGKLKTLTFPSTEMQVPYQFLLKNSYASDVTAGAQPALQFQQLDGQREQRTADVLMAAGRRTVSSTAYDAVVKKYKAKPSAALLAELKTGCAAVLGTDDKWLEALNGLKTNYEASLTLVKTEKAKDAASWGPLEERLTQQVTGIATEVTRVEGVKKNDAGACPKSR